MDGRDILDMLAEQAPPARPQYTQQVLHAARRTRLHHRAIGLLAAASVALGITASATILLRPALQAAGETTKTVQTADPAAEPYAASIIALAEQMRGRQLERARTVYILSHTCANIGIRPPSRQACASSRPIGAQLRRDLAAALRPYAPVVFIADPAAVIGSDPSLTVDNGGILVTLGPIQLTGTTARVPIAIQRTADDARGLTYLLTRQNSQWTVTGATSGAWIS